MSLSFAVKTATLKTLFDEFSNYNAEWHIGEAKPRISSRTERVIFLSADGDELAYILEKFDGIPKPSDKHHLVVVQWSGDIADFILRNL